jgi:hypothetical protein
MRFGNLAFVGDTKENKIRGIGTTPLPAVAARLLLVLDADACHC